MIDFNKYEGLSFYALQIKYNLTIQEVMSQYIIYRNSL